MRLFQQTLSIILLTLAASMSSSVHAHLMVVQHGTLNIVDDDVFMVLSLPISVFEGIDDDSDGKISMIEFNNHRAAIVERVRAKVILSDKESNRPLQGIMLSPVISHHASNKPLSQLTVMGKYTLNKPHRELSFHTDLYGKQVAEQVLEITATRKVDSKKHVFKLTPNASTVVLFSDSQQGK